MHSLQFTAESSSNGLVERDFTVGEIPGVLWSPASGADRAPLVLMGHGGGHHKKHPAMAGRAQRLVTGCGFHVAVIDVPGHGDRPRTAHDEQEIAALYRARAALHANAGKHKELPRFEADSAVRFFTRHFGRAVTSLA
jgi:hypothetical protein